ncbi:DUF1643 domain-containing protein [Priestia aryabhattai]|uniref:DUF1643 domain-containing protein n=1 Tax=Priestia aryabhattai TaxID=412384 RepID=UPI0005EC01F6|nr:DUF1643 domain-containing protein [Priestia aryabhattai]KJL02518.1 hypothetical protein N178_22510 [Priestia aryabhattai B8W22]
MQTNILIKSEAEFSKDESATHRYLLKKVWDEEKSIVTIIMLNPRKETDALYLDKSVMLFMNYCISKNFGGFYIVNLFSYRCNSESKLKAIDYDKRYDQQTDKWIRHAVNNSVKLYIGWGSNNNRKKRIKQIQEMLRECNDIDIVKLNTVDDREVHMSRSTLKKTEVVINIDKIL